MTLSVALGAGAGKQNPAPVGIVYTGVTLSGAVKV
jgi:hypothetical protein